MPTKEGCDSATPFGLDEQLHCGLDKDHTNPTGAHPQGTPHEDPDHPDVITGEPWKWWG